MKVLFLTTVLPRKKRMGSECASQGVIDALTRIGCQATVVGYVREDDEYRLGPQEICAERRPIETKDAGLHPLLWLAGSLLRGLPYSVAKYLSGTFVSSVRKLMHDDHYDLVILDHVQMSWLLQSVPLAGKIIGIAHNVEHQMHQSFIQGETNPLRRWVYQREVRLLRRMESAFANSVDQLWVFTKSDEDFFAGVKKRESVKEIPLPAGVIPSELTTPTKDCDVGLIGSWTWKANEQGLRWFLDRVYPHLPVDVTIRVAGSGAKWLEGRYSNVNYLGFVIDAQEFLQQARAVAIPTLSGGGIQIKTLDAIASGSPIVATPLALRGIDDRPTNVAVAESPEQFAALLCAAIAATDMNSSAAGAIRWSRLRRGRFRAEIEQGIQDLVRSH